MRIIAPMMILIMMTSTLAGCTGGDPDSGGEMDSDAINDLIDQNLQDFINNTTITVNQEIHHHYYNNTTVNEGDMTNNDYTVEYNNTTVNEGNTNNQYDNSQDNYSFGAVGTGNGSGETLFLLDIQFNLSDLMTFEVIDYRNNSFNYSWEYYDYATNEQRTDIFEFSCQVFYLVGANSTNGTNQVSYWEDYSQYSNAWSNIYNSTVSELLQNAANDNALSGVSIQSICDEDYMVTNYDNLLLIEIPIIEGMSIKGVYDTVGGYAQEEYVWSRSCDYVGVTYDGNGNSMHDYEYTGEYAWRQSIYILNCEDGYNGDMTWSAFSVEYQFETITWSYNYGSWVGGSSDSTLEVYVNNIFPDHEYRLIAYYKLSNTALIG